jgi:ribA/ribD-fused uncharacterized protein
MKTHHKLDTDTHVFFYEQEFYVLSNFSAFTLYWKQKIFQTSEAAYHYEKFTGNPTLQDLIHGAPSAHEAYKIAGLNKDQVRKDWFEVRTQIMRNILIAKASQHQYVLKKLLESGDRELVEDSWRDDYWGWGPNKDGENMLGKLWMEVRALFQQFEPTTTGIGSGHVLPGILTNIGDGYAAYCPGIGNAGQPSSFINESMRNHKESK